MNDWNADYVTELAYTYEYFNELNPLHLRWLLLYAGLAAPACHTACELGYGQGLSINIHAATSACRWYGTDYNPEQALFARSMAGLYHNSAQLYDDSFAELAAREDLPDFDFIAMHGIWSWVSDENRQIIKDFIARKLKDGGVLYVSYNCQPGYGGMEPLRHIMLEYSHALIPAAAPMPERVNNSLDFLNTLLAADPAYVQEMAQTKAHFRYLQAQDRSYLAHEYFNTNWQPFYFSEMHAHMREAGLSYACSATPKDHLSDVNFTDAQKQYLQSMADPVLRESTADFLCRRQFRRDFWIKRPRSLAAAEREKALRNLSCILTGPVEDFSFEISGLQGTATLKEAIFRPLLALLADGKVHSIDRLARQLAPSGLGFEPLLHCLMTLYTKCFLRIARLPGPAEKEDSLRLNAGILQRARTENHVDVLASPVVGGGVSAPRHEQLFALALQEDPQSGPAQWADFAWQHFADCGQALVLEGQRLRGAAAHQTALRQLAEDFARKTLPLWRVLRMLP